MLPGKNKTDIYSFFSRKLMFQKARIFIFIFFGLFSERFNKTHIFFHIWESLTTTEVTCHLAPNASSPTQRSAQPHGCNHIVLEQTWPLLSVFICSCILYISAPKPPSLGKHFRTCSCCRGSTMGSCMSNQQKVSGSFQPPNLTESELPCRLHCCYSSHSGYAQP